MREIYVYLSGKMSIENSRHQIGWGNKKIQKSGD
jgi:hypothetical protein